MVLLALGPWAAAAGATDGSWATQGDMGTLRNVPALVSLGSGKALVSGGVIDNAGAEIFNNGNWTAAGSMSTGRIGHRLVLLDSGKVLAVGGAAGVGQAATSEVELFNPATDTWSDETDANTARYLPAVAKLNDGRVLVVGGMNGEDGNLGVAPDAEVYDPAAHTWTTVTMGTSRAFTTAVPMSNGKVLVAGGMTDPTCACSRVSSTEIFNPATNTFTAGPALPGPARGHLSAVALTTGKVLVFAGYDDSDNELSSAYLYDPVGNSFSPTGTMTAPGGGDFAFVLHSGLVLAFAENNQAQLYDPGAGTWRNTASPAIQRANSAAALLNTDRVLLVGGFNINPCCNHQETTELYTPPPWLAASAVAFGPQPVSVSSAQTATITNTGGKSLTITSTSLAGANAGDFAKTSDGCAGQTLVVDATCQVQLKFTPSAVGSRSAALQIADNAPDTPQSVSLNGSGSGAPGVVTSAGTTAWTEADNVASTPVAVDGALTVADGDSSTLSSATVSITSGLQTGEDVLAFTNDNGAAFGNISASYSVGTGVLTLTSATATATVAQWQAALRAVTYTDTSETPDPSTRTMSFVANDGSQAGNAATKTVSVAAVDDAPVLTASNGALSYTQGDPAATVDSGLGASDADSGSLTGATAAITAGLNSSEDVLGFTNQNGITGNWSANTGVLTLSGTATVAQYRAALRSVTYANSSSGPSTTDRIVTFRATSASSAQSVAATRTVHVLLVAPGSSAAPAAPAFAREGHQLTAAQGSWTGSTPIALATRWQQCDAAGLVCTDIPGASGTSYTPVAGDVGQRLRVVVTATNPLTSAERASDPTGVVRAHEVAPTITGAPPALTANAAAALTWTGEAGATFECALDGGAFAACSSPYTPAGLADGAHTLLVRQTAEGVTSPNASTTWTLDSTPPAAPTITGGPEGEVAGLDASFGFSATEPGATFECRVDDAAFAACASPFAVTVTAGEHRFEVRARDAAGNAGPAAARTWAAGAAAESGEATQVDGVVGASGTVAADGDQVAVGCAVDAGSIQRCDVAVFAGGGARGASAAARVRIGGGHTVLTTRGVRQVPVTVKLTVKGLRILRRSRTGAVTFSFTVRTFDSAKILHASRGARIRLSNRFVVAARRGFAGDSAALDPPTVRYLARLARFLGAGASSVRCEGHADNSGTASYARHIGLLRARMVCAFLRTHGVKARFAAVSFGASRPVASNRTAAGRARNRRVEVVVR